MINKVQTENMFNIGNTSIRNFSRLDNNIFLKMENENPTGSIKDRSVWYMVQHKLLSAKNKDEEINFVIASSGNAGISLAYLCKLWGHKCTVFVSNNIEDYKYRLLRKLGAQVVRCSGELANQKGGWIYESKQFYDKLDKANKYYIDQFADPLNIEAHFAGTAPEIYDYFCRKSQELDFIFLGVGSGGTAAGIQKYIAQQKISTKVIICDPVGGIFYDSYHGNDINYIDHNIEAISDSFIPDNINDIRMFYDVVKMPDDIIYKGRELLLADAHVLAQDVTAFVYATLLNYIHLHNLKGKNILLLNTEGGFR